MKRFWIILAVCLLASSSALASSPDEWAKHRQAVTTACLEASGLENPQPAGEIVTFADQVGYDAMLVKGIYPQPQMQRQTGQVLCLFNRQTRQAFTSDADAMVNAEPNIGQ